MKKTNQEEAVQRESALHDGAVADLPSFRSSASQQRALWIFAVLALAVVVWLSLPVGIGLLLGTLTAFSIEPFYQRLLKRFRRPQLAAVVTVFSVAIGLVGILGSMGYLFVQRALVQAEHAKGFLQRFGSLINQRLPKEVIDLDLLIQPGDLLKDLESKITNWASHIKQVTAVAGSVLGGTLTMLLSVFFMLLTMHFILRHWSRMSAQAELVLPLHPRHTRALFAEFRMVGRSVLLGTILTGLAQGVLAGLGYWVAGAPDPLLFGAITAIASLIPVVGTVLIWVPIGVYMILNGQVVGGAFTLLYGGLVVVGVSDYLIRPFLVGRRGQSSVLVTFIALFGGVEAFGVIGLVLGPVLMALAVSLLRIYLRERSSMLPDPLLTASPE